MRQWIKTGLTVLATSLIFTGCSTDQEEAQDYKPYDIGTHRSYPDQGFAQSEAYLKYAEFMGFGNNMAGYDNASRNVKPNANRINPNSHDIMYRELARQNNQNAISIENKLARNGIEGAQVLVLGNDVFVYPRPSQNNNVKVDYSLLKPMIHNILGNDTDIYIVRDKASQKAMQNVHANNQINGKIDRTKDISTLYRHAEKLN